MKNPWTLLALFSILLFLWYLRPATHAPIDASGPTIQKTIITEEPPQLKARFAPPVAPVKTASKVQVLEKPQLPAEPYAGPMQSVHFKMEDGLAVAFGDQILGVPVSDGPISEGFNKPTPVQLWPRPEIPYAINPEVPNPERIETALQHIRENTVVNFVPLKEQKDGIVFEVGDTNCKSYLGRVGGLQPIKISNVCGWVEIVHEVMHAMGFIHEQSRTDRDQFINVEWNNIQDEYKDQFAMVPQDLMGPLRGFPFDYHSVMLYPPGLFAKSSGEDTLKSKGPEPVAPSDKGLSAQDIERINSLFGRK